MHRLSLVKTVAMPSSVPIVTLRLRIIKVVTICVVTIVAMP